MTLKMTLKPSGIGKVAVTAYIHFDVCNVILNEKEWIGSLQFI